MPKLSQIRHKKNGTRTKDSGKIHLPIMRVHRTKLKMASVIVTLKIMPTSPEENLDQIYEQADKHIRNFVDQKHKESEIKKEIEPIGFGLKALKILFIMDESIGATDKLEEQIKKIQGVESVEAVDVRRTIG